MFQMLDFLLLPSIFFGISEAPTVSLIILRRPSWLGALALAPGSDSEVSACPWKMMEDGSESGWERIGNRESIWESIWKSSDFF